MKTSVLIAIVVVLHCAAIGSLCFIQGCGTPSGTSNPPPAAVMPPTHPPTPIPTPRPVMTPSLPSPKAEALKTPETDVSGALKDVKKTDKTTEYRVKAGDSIGSIAKHCHVPRAELMAMNKMTDPNKLKAGQKLIIPASSTVPVKAAPKAAVTKSGTPVETTKAALSESVAKGSDNKYEVKHGDSLSKIAAKSGVKVSAIRDANKLSSDKIRTGQKLIIPEAKKIAAETKAASVSKPIATAVPVAPATAPAPDVPATAPTAAPAVSAPATDVKPPAVPVLPTAAAASTSPVAGVAASDASAVVAPSGAPAIYHTVRPEEDLKKIAELYGVTLKEFVDVNQLGTNTTVQPGQRLRIP